MRDDRFIQAYERVSPSPAARKSMLAHVLASREASCQTGGKRRAVSFGRGLPAACAAAALLCMSTVPQFFPVEDVPAVIQQAAPGADSPNGVRKMMNYDGLRYVFLENGAAYDLEPSVLSQPLGTLSYDIQQDPETYGFADCAASFAVGGTVYQIDGYDPAFRLAVEWEGQYYIAQCVDTLDGSPLELSRYFDAANLQGRTKEMQVCDHAGRNVLCTFTADDAKALLALLSQALPAEFTNEEYQEIARAQRSGGSYQLVFRLEDSTAYTMYVIPSLSVVSAGDNRYRMADEYVQELQDLFSGIQQTSPPME